MRIKSKIIYLVCCHFSRSFDSYQETYKYLSSSNSKLLFPKADYSKFPVDYQSLFNWYKDELRPRQNDRVKIEICKSTYQCVLKILINNNDWILKFVTNNSNEINWFLEKYVTAFLNLQSPPSIERPMGGYLRFYHIITSNSTFPIGPLDGVIDIDL